MHVLGKSYGLIHLPANIHSMFVFKFCQFYDRCVLSVSPKGIPHNFLTVKGWNYVPDGARPYEKLERLAEKRFCRRIQRQMAEWKAKQEAKLAMTTTETNETTETNGTTETNENDFVTELQPDLAPIVIARESE